MFWVGFSIFISIVYSWKSWPFPHYLQCNGTYGNDTMGVPNQNSDSTICGQGCAMTSVSMGMAGLGLNINGKYPDPNLLNEWLRNNNGYTCIDGNCNNLVLWKIDDISGGHLVVTDNQSLTHPSMNDIRRGLDAKDTVILAHNPKLYHFVLATNASWSDDVFSVIDPYFNATTYTYNETEGQFIVYNIYGIPRDYVYYAQCNDTWGNDVMGTNGKTICQVGCLMSSISMGMYAYNIPVSINNQIVPTTPKTLNIWLQNNNGYASGSSNLIESSLNNIPQNRIVWNSNGMHTKNDIPRDIIRSYVQDNPRKIVIANVMNGEHFVLVTNIESDMDTLNVNDPGQFHDTYSYSNDVVGWRIFDMS